MYSTNIYKIFYTKQENQQSTRYLSLPIESRHHYHYRNDAITRIFRVMTSVAKTVPSTP